MKKSKQGYSPVRVRVYSETGRKIDRYVRFKKIGCKYYFNAQHIFIELSSKDRSFFDYLCENMDNKNRVIVDVHFKQEYINFMNEILGKDSGIKVSGIDQTLKKLKLLGLIFLVNDTRSYFNVNPRYVFQGTELARTKLLRDLIQNRFNAGLDIGMLLDISIDEFLGKSHK
jgi:hypothetical protein